MDSVGLLPLSTAKSELGLRREEKQRDSMHSARSTSKYVQAKNKSTMKKTLFVPCCMVKARSIGLPLLLSMLRVLRWPDQSSSLPSYQDYSTAEDLSSPNLTVSTLRPCLHNGTAQATRLLCLLSAAYCFG